ncbi:MAG: RNA-binding protein [Rhodomicrobium sp.]|nr:RNA-binding protein [Rhodomicrobium sp.]
MTFLCEEDKEKAKPIRQCALTRTRSREDDLLRFVLDPENRVVPDIKRKLPGRGVWITAAYDAVASSVRRKVFARSFRQSVTVDETLADTVAELLRRAALQDLALVNKAGRAVSGYVKVEKALRAGKPVILLHAANASPDGCRKLDRIAGQISSQAGAQGRGPLAGFTSSELSVALGKDNVNHAAVATGDGIGRKFLRSAERYMDYIATRPAAAQAAEAPEQDQA